MQKRALHVLYQGGLLLEMLLDAIHRLDECTNSPEPFIVLCRNGDIQLPENRRVNVLNCCPPGICIENPVMGLNEVPHVGYRNTRKFFLQGQFSKGRSQNTVFPLPDQAAPGSIPQDHQVILTDRNTVIGFDIVFNNAPFKGFDVDVRLGGLIEVAGEFGGDI